MEIDVEDDRSPVGADCLDTPRGHDVEQRGRDAAPYHERGRSVRDIVRLNDDTELPMPSQDTETNDVRGRVQHGDQKAMGADSGSWRSRLRRPLMCTRRLARSTARTRQQETTG